MEHVAKGSFLKNAKAIAAWVIKECNPHWIPPVDGPSGGQIIDSLNVVKMQVYKSCSKSKLCTEMPKDYKHCNFPVFQYLGLPRGDRECLPILKTPLSGSGPAKKTKEIISAEEVIQLNVMYFDLIFFVQCNLTRLFNQTKGS